MINELRSRKRMPTANLKSSIRVKKGFINSIWEKARPQDFTLFGMCLKTNRIYDLDDTITVSLTLELDMGEIHIEQIGARVARVKKLVGFYEYGIEFDKKVVQNTANDTSIDMMRIENVLQKQSAFAAKIEQKSA